MFKETHARLATAIHRTLAAVATVVMLFVAAPAPAQMGEAAGFAELMRHDYLHRDIVLFAQGLEMDEGQRIIMESLYEDYRATFDAGWLGTQERLSEMLQDVRSATPEQAMEMVMAPFEDWRKEKERIKETFEENVKVILNREQLQQWPAFQRQMLREKTLHLGRLSGESVDLFHVVRDLQLDDRIADAIEPVMEQYDLALDEALRRRNALLDEVQVDLMRSIRSGQSAIEVKKLEDQVQRRVALRDVNEHYIEVIASSLPVEHGEKFREAALVSAYPRVYRQLPAERIFLAALELEDLEEEDRSAITELYEIMSTEIDSLNASLHRAIREHEPKALVNQMEIFTARTRGEEVTRIPDPTHEKIRERDERAGYYVALLREILTPDQFTSLPGYSRWMHNSNARRAIARPERGTDRSTIDTREDASDRSSGPRGLGEQAGERGGRDSGPQPSRGRGGRRGG